jgi:hypothetical protein
MNDPSRRRRIRNALLCLLIAAALWIPSVHLLFRSADHSRVWTDPGVSPYARSLARRHLAFWSDPDQRRRELGDLRRSNPEWDFMGRTFLVLALANMALRDPAMKDQALSIIDPIVEETLSLEKAHGFHHFSMAYSRRRPYVDGPARSQFVDGEIALMIGARRLVAEKESWREPLRERARLMVERMRRSPSLSAESYPDECWTFDNATALAALRIADVLDGSDHRDLCRDWVRHARAFLVEERTGLLVSEYTRSGEPQDGPEGSSLWMAAHMLQLVDEAFARDQYDRARLELRRSLCGFDVSREWPVGSAGRMDIDSGIVIPGIDASPGASGLALLGARAFGDEAYYTGLLRSLEMAAFPIRDRDSLRYAAGNQVGDAVLLYSTVLGPLWAEVRRRTGS